MIFCLYIHYYDIYCSYSAVLTFVQAYILPTQHTMHEPNIKIYIDTYISAYYMQCMPDQQPSNNVSFLFVYCVYSRDTQSIRVNTDSICGHIYRRVNSPNVYRTWDGGRNQTANGTASTAPATSAARQPWQGQAKQQQYITSGESTN